MIGRTNAEGGGGITSDETTVTASHVLANDTYLGADTNDEAGTGTMPNIQAVDPAKSISYGSGIAYARMTNGAHITNASSGYPEVSIPTQTKSVSPTASAQTVNPDANKILSSVTVNGVSNLSAGNIKNGVTVGGTTGTYKGLGNASASQVLSGVTFSTASLSNASGTMPNYSGNTSTSNYVSSTFRFATSGYVFASPGATGYYSTSSYLRIPASNLTAANIKKGVSIMGIIGSFQGMVDSPYYLMKKSSSGSFPSVVSEMYSTPLVVTKTNTGYSEDDYGSSYFSSYFKLGSGTSAGAFRLLKFNSDPISFAAYSKLYFRISSTLYGNGFTYQRFGVSSNGAITSNNFQAYVDTASSISNGLYEINITALTGSYFIYLWQQLPGTGSRGSSGSCVVLYEMYLMA